MSLKETFSEMQDHILNRMNRKYFVNSCMAYFYTHKFVSRSLEGCELTVSIQNIPFPSRD